jgi:hypothetical protein
MRSHTDLKSTFERIPENEIAGGIRWMVEHKEIPIWVQFATQTYIDIQDLLGERLDAPLDDLQNHFEAVKDRRDAFLSNNLIVDRYNRGLPERAQRPINDMKTSISRLQTYLKKYFFKSSLKAVGEHPYLSKLENDDHALLRRHPVGCGVLQYDMFHDLHRYGLQLEWATDCIRPMIYLTTHEPHTLESLPGASLTQELLVMSFQNASTGKLTRWCRDGQR